MCCVLQEPLSPWSVVHLLSVPCYHYHSTCLLLLRTTPDKRKKQSYSGMTPITNKMKNEATRPITGVMVCIFAGSEGIMERHGEEKKPGPSVSARDGSGALVLLSSGPTGLGRQGGCMREKFMHLPLSSN